MKARTVILTVLALGGAGLAAFTLMPKQPKLATVMAQQVKQETFVKEVSAVGTVKASKSRPLAFATSGTVATVLVKLGDGVQKGQKLIQLDTNGLQNDLNSAQVGLRAAEADLIKAQGNVGTDALDARKLVEQSRNAVISAQTALLQARAQLKLQKELFEIGSIPRTDYQQAQTTEQEASLKLQGVQLDLEAATLRREGAQKLSGATLQNAQSALQTARTRVMSLKKQLQDTVLTAPLDGVVSSLNVTPGGFAAAGTPAIEITNLGQLYLEVPFDETRSKDLTPGQPASIEFDALPGQKTAGRVLRVNPTATVSQAGGSQSTSVNAQIAFQQPQVKPGFTASVKVETLRRKNTLTVPLEALTEEGGAHVLRVKPDAKGEGTIEKVNVKILDRNVKVAAIEGLALNDQVLTLNLDTVKVGEKVRIEKP